MEKLRQESTEKQRPEDELITKQRDSNGEGRSSITKPELPKLVVTKFNGTHMDWIRFWSQFETEIDKSNLPSISKEMHLYLNGMLEPKVC